MQLQHYISIEMHGLSMEIAIFAVIRCSRFDNPDLLKTVIIVAVECIDLLGRDFHFPRTVSQNNDFRWKEKTESAWNIDDIDLSISMGNLAFE